jgi:hypothetical protein
MLQGPALVPAGLRCPPATAALCPPALECLVREPHEPHERALVGQARDPES